VGVQTHVLRYWESEFPSIRPQKSRSGQRVYSRKDVAKLLRVKELLYAEGFTIAGARQKLRSKDEPRAKDEEPTVADGPSGASRADAVRVLHEILVGARADVLRALSELDELGPSGPETASAGDPRGARSVASGNEGVADQDAEVLAHGSRRDGDGLLVRR
jgi:DNA-binding transcriptional MerR regulator